MEKITVKKAELLDKLRTNRADHQAIYHEALEGFVTETARSLEIIALDLRRGKHRDVKMFASVPREHTKEYDRAIAMIEMSIGETIVLSETDFAQYVMDDWGWQEGFLSNSYGSKTATGKFSDRYDVR